MTAKSDKDPDPHGSALIWLPWFRIRIVVKSLIRTPNETNADPKHCLKDFFCNEVQTEQAVEFLAKISYIKADIYGTYWYLTVRH